MFFFNFFFIFNFFAIFPINFGYQKRKKSKFSKALSEAENEFAFFVFFYIPRMVLSFSLLSFSAKIER